MNWRLNECLRNRISSLCVYHSRSSAYFMFINLNIFDVIYEVCERCARFFFCSFFFCIHFCTPFTRPRFVWVDYESILRTFFFGCWLFHCKQYTNLSVRLVKSHTLNGCRIPTSFITIEQQQKIYCVYRWNVIGWWAKWTNLFFSHLFQSGTLHSLTNKLHSQGYKMRIYLEIFECHNFLAHRASICPEKSVWRELNVMRVDWHWTLKLSYVLINVRSLFYSHEWFSRNIHITCVSYKIQFLFN